MIENYPDAYDAPLPILQLEGNCGVIAAWSVFKYFHKRVSSAQLIRECNHTGPDGVFTIALALALHKLGLSVSFHTDPDPAPQPFEKQCYQAANDLGMRVRPAIEIDALLKQVDATHIAIVLYNEDGGGHFSPLLGIQNDKLLLPYAGEDDFTKDEFINKWDAPEICRQCILVSFK